MITVTKEAADQVAQAKVSLGDFVKRAIIERQ